MSVIQKLSTGIFGLDELFYGGFQVTKDVLTKTVNQGMIIAVYGTQGCNKTLMSLQLMQGLTKSIVTLNRREDRTQIGKPQFYSIDKNRSELTDLYLDFLIEKQLDLMTKERIEQPDKWINHSLSDCLFDTSRLMCEESVSKEDRVMIPADLAARLDKYICEDLVYYNPRTKSLHFRRMREGADQFNILYKRRSSDINAYNLKGGFEDEFVKADFVEMPNGDQESTRHYYSAPSVQRLTDYICSLDPTLDPRTDLPDQKIPCIVIDGFSHIASPELETLPYDYMLSVLRRTTPVSILVFDERYDDTKIGADVIIRMQSRTSEIENYMMYEMQITKSVFQEATIGWHLYKKRSSILEVYPSLHRILRKRRYSSSELLTSHRPMFSESYMEYIHRKVNAGEEYSGEDYLPQQQSYPLDKLRSMYMERYGVEEKKDQHDQEILTKILFGKGRNTDHHPDSTAIVGNPNSYKRMFTLAKAFHLAKKGEHTLILLLDKDRENMMRQMFCPAIAIQKAGCPPCLSKSNQLEIQSCSSCSLSCQLKACIKCYHYIHFLDIRMGCITPEELLMKINEQLAVAFADGKKMKHLIVDDLQVIDYSFPFLKESPLFLTALYTFCADRDIELTLMCDKKASCVREVCKLSDNVICINRDKADEIDVYVEQYEQNPVPSEVLKYSIQDPLKMFCPLSDDDGAPGQGKCCGIAFRQDGFKGRVERIGSMKDYWRQKVNLVASNADVKL